VTYMILGLLIMASVHFIYEGILAPSFRLKLRFELFSLRDELRQLKIDCAQSLSDKHFDYLQDSLNGLIAVLHRYDAGTLAAVEHELRTNPELRADIEARVRILDDCNIPRARTIRNRSLWIAGKALATNNGAWFCYLLPLALPLFFVSRLKKLIRASLSLSEPDLNKVAPFAEQRAATPR